MQSTRDTLYSLAIYTLLQTQLPYQEVHYDRP